jgi:hypothetical protein
MADHGELPMPHHNPLLLSHQHKIFWRFGLPGGLEMTVVGEILDVQNKGRCCRIPLSYCSDKSFLCFQNLYVWS